jgi:hypothetical protein
MWLLAMSGEAKLDAGAGSIVGGAADFAAPIVRPFSRYAYTVDRRM